MDAEKAMAMLEIEGRRDLGWRARWRVVRDLIGGALILAVWLGLWAWVAVGVGAPLSRVHGELRGSAAGSSWQQGA